MTIEFLIPALFGLKATALLGFATHQIIVMRAARRARRVAAEVSPLPRRDHAARAREEKRLAA